MTHKYPHLASPITIGNVTFRNRMFAAPVGGTDITADCCVGPRTPAFYELKAKGGAAAVTCMAERPTTGTRRCTVNPLIGRECEGTDVTPAARSKRVLVAGGGVAGMKAAITAAQRGHRVVLCEKSDQLGGILKSEQALPFKYDMYRLGLSLARAMEIEGVEVRLNTPVTPELLKQEAPEALILAVGSQPIVPPLPGMDGDNVVIVNDYYLQKDKVKDTVVVLGGGLAGCECAVHLGMEGKRVHLVEMRDTLAPERWMGSGSVHLISQLALTASPQGEASEKEKSAVPGTALFFIIVLFTAWQIPPGSSWPARRARP